MGGNTYAYEELVNAIIYRASDDYLFYNREYFRLEKKYKKEIENPTYIPFKEGETYSCYKKRKQRHSPTRYKNQMENTKLIVNAIDEFFMGDWIKEISDIDGEKILNELRKQLKKEGHNLWDLQ